MQYAYRLSSAQNAWQDSRLAVAGISTPSLWNLTGLICQRQSKFAMDLLLSTRGYDY
jgi:hypothetical protein